jgi:hypothetical protein
MAPRTYAEKLLAHHGLQVPVLIAYHDVDLHKPDPEPIKKAAERLKVPVERVIYVGDDADDILAASRAGAIPVGISWDRSLEQKSENKLASALCRNWTAVIAAIRQVTCWDTIRYDRKAIGRDMLFEWTDDDYYLLLYFPKSSTHRDPVTNFILDFKRNDDEAVRMATGLFLSAIESMEHDLRDIRHCSYVVAIPHSAALRPNEPCERVCSAVANKFQWLKHLPDSLVRIEPVQSSHLTAAGNKPTYADHLRTIRYRGQQISDGANIIMFDDILTRRVTSRACRDILKQATSCKLVVGMYLGRTQ